MCVLSLDVQTKKIKIKEAKINNNQEPHAFISQKIQTQV